MLRKGNPSPPGQVFGASPQSGRTLTHELVPLQGHLWRLRTVYSMLFCMMVTARIEAFRPPSNRRPTQGLLNRALLTGRRFLDLQLSSVLHDVRPWLKARSGSLLEIGCGDQPYRDLVPANVHYAGL